LGQERNTSERGLLGDDRVRSSRVGCLRKEEKVKLPNLETTTTLANYHHHNHGLGSDHNDYHGSINA